MKIMIEGMSSPFVVFYWLIDILFMKSKIKNENNISIFYFVDYLISIQNITCKNEFDKTGIKNEFTSFCNCIFNKSSKY